MYPVSVLLNVSGQLLVFLSDFAVLNCVDADVRTVVDYYWANKMLKYEKSTDIGMAQNYVTVTRCIGLGYGDVAFNVSDTECVC